MLPSKTFTFKHGVHFYGYAYVNPKRVIDDIVELADTDKCNFDLMDCHQLVIQLGRYELEAYK